MNYVSLFSGIGGMDYGLERAGLTCVAQAETDPYRRRVLERHWPGILRFEDVRDVCNPDGADLLQRLGDQGRRDWDAGRDGERGGIDLICGGFPCQDLSVAGRRAGLGGDRSGLFFEFARILGEVRPRWCLIENVPGLLSSDKGRDFAVVLYELQELGYGVAWRVLDSRYFGVPQRRRRVYIVGHLGSPAPAAAVLFEREGVRGDTPQGREEGQGVAAPLGASTSSYGGQQCDLDNETYVAASSVRRLTPTECERLQALPDGWTLDGSEKTPDGPRYAGLGDAVTATVAYWIGSRVLAVG